MYRSQRQSGPPKWFVFLIGVALIFGLYYLWVGLQDYMESGGLGIREATEQAATQIVATEAREAIIQTNIPTRRPSVTPLPECQDFVVIVPSAIVRADATTGSQILDSLPEGTEVCVIEHLPDSTWYLVDRNTSTRRLEPAYMHEDIIAALNPTPTPSNTFTPAPTVTMTPSLTPSHTPTTGPTHTPDPNTTDTPTPTPTPTDTPDNVSA